MGEAYFSEGLTTGGNFAFLKRANSPNFQQSLGLYSGGLIFGRIFASEIWGAFFSGGLISEFYDEKFV